MNNILGVFIYEFRMGIRRKGVWLAYGVIFLFYLFVIISTGQFLETPGMSTGDMWALTAVLAFIYNLFLPVIGGIATADRLIRDRSLHVYELLFSTGLRLSGYIVGKYLGALAAISLPSLLGILAIRIYSLFLGAPLVTIGMSIVTFLVINLPAYAFITAFSLACPLVIPTRVYQVLFTGYWFWGNFLYPGMFPTLSGTLLQASGRIPAEGWFGSVIEMVTSQGFTSTEAWINLGLIVVCITLALLTAGKYLSIERRLA
jgi:ABC-2 type transport system permease protein